MTKEERRKHWLKLTGLLPPDEREQIKEEKPDMESLEEIYELSKKDDCWNGHNRLGICLDRRRAGHLPEEDSPSWDDIIKAYEDSMD
jgi:hypothetical protein